MKKINILLVATFLTMSFCSFTTIKDSTSITSKKKFPRGVFVGFMTITAGSYADTYSVYAFEDDHSVCEKVINSNNQTFLITGSGYAPTLTSDGSYSFSFNNDATQEVFSFISPAGTIQ